MAVGKEIRTKIGSIKSTQKITKAMEMVAASKIRKTQDRMAAGKPYAEKIRAVIGHMANGNPEYNHLYLKEREVQRVGFIVISSDRGLCGGLNTNLFKKLLGEMRSYRDAGVEMEFCAIGQKAVSFFRNFGGSVSAALTQMGDDPSAQKLIGTVKVMLKAYEEGKIDRLILAHNQFVNTMTQQPEAIQLLPLVPSSAKEFQHRWDYIYEPEAKMLVDGLMQRYVESLVYQGVIENLACEQAARMVAMKSATDNAGEIIKDLQLIYNKARQSAITQEISEIVSGAAAV